ncbi:MULTISPECIES: SMC-Scp complex subunit ScpB [Bacillaceae]|uniref:Segregation and condensation protein B n=1 Tax=Domibacillus aminovorans TaxID=29332 RepID=A0A177KXR9_9BACI|nr:MULTISPECIES: SMC-Scp complex subunit ScpB [Bacillaceae]OAH55933.1 segregation and condensation protein B [Domibacillus aminovorans]OAH58189.1 segregation and condensation protein B [Domibacillus aminovorans]
MTNESIIESLLFAAGDEGLSAEQMADVLDVDVQTVQHVIERMAEAFLHDDMRGVTITTYGEEYRLMTKKENAPFIQALAEKPSPKTLSQAALETLAIIAYNQPVTRIEVEDIRGVKTERPIATLAARGLIEEAGRAEGAGRPILYKTTTEFLDAFQLKNLDELPPLSEGEVQVQQEADLFFGRFEEAMGETTEE